VGDHFASAQGGRFASPGVTRVLDWLRACGIEGFGQSSWGPTGFALCPGEEAARRLLSEARRRFADEIALDFVVTRGRNEGARIRSESLVH
jgi:predicted sugar kinase